MFGWLKTSSNGESPRTLVSEGFAAHQLGKFAAAKSAYQRALSLDPHCADALYLLGTIALAESDPLAAVDTVNRAIAIDANVSSYHQTLGIALRDVGKLREAVVAFERAIALDPSDLDTLRQLVATLEALDLKARALTHCRRLPELQSETAEDYFQLGRLEAIGGSMVNAENAFRKALSLDPALHAARLNLGNTLLGQDRFEEAIEQYQRVLQVEPHNRDAMLNLSSSLTRAKQYPAAEKYLKAILEEYPECIPAWTQLGLVLREQTRLDEAEIAFRTVHRLDPDHSDNLLDLADLLTRVGKLRDAEALLRHALQFRSQDAKTHLGLAQVYSLSHRFEDAEQAYRRALELEPRNVGCLIGFSHMLYMQSRGKEAEELARKAVEIAPNSGDGSTVLGLALMMQGKPSAAEEELRKAVTIDPNNLCAWSTLLLTLNYDIEKDKQSIAKDHFAFGTASEAAVAHLPRLALPARSGEGKLRIGYVSTDFHEHSVAYFFEPVLRHHDRSRFEVFCYYTGSRFDSTTERIQAQCDHWRHLPSVAADAALERVRADGLDVAIDLSGHTFGDQLRLFAARIAPVQITWLGYPNTTGLRNMDWRITDAAADPESAEALHSEKLLRLPGSFLTVRRPAHAPDVAAPPSEKRGFITFGSFNNHFKISEEVLGLWAKIVTGTPGSQLLVKAMGLRSPEAQTRFRQAAYAAGFKEDQLRLVGPVASPAEHLAMYNEVDVALDTYPYHGTTTTTDALWMGVPTIVLAGDRHASRVGVSLLRSVGADSLVANSHSEYIEIATRLAKSPRELSMWRLCLRDRIAGSVLGDNAAFTRNLEQAIANVALSGASVSRGMLVETHRGDHSEDRRAKIHTAELA